MVTSHPFSTDHTDDVNAALEYFVNSFMHRGEGRSVKLDFRHYLEVANRKRDDLLFPFHPLPRFSAEAAEKNFPTFANVLTTRSSVREFSKDAMPLETLSQILYLSAGIRHVEAHGTTFRHWPSAGGLFPVNLFLCVQNVVGLEPGVYSYDPHEHGVRHLRGAADSQQCMSALLGAQPWIENASCAILLAADMDKTLWKYGGRGLRYVFLDCGHLGQNLSLCAHAVGAGSCAIGGFCEKELHQSLGLSIPDEAVMYALAVGMPKQVETKTGNSVERYL
jgi:SagB-type dehydrogenase family enzyme